MVTPHRKVSAVAKNSAIKRLDFTEYQDPVETRKYVECFDKERFGKNRNILFNAIHEGADKFIILYQDDEIGLSYGGGFANILESCGSLHLLATLRDLEAPNQPDLLDTGSGVSYGNIIQECIVGHGTSETAMFHKGTLLVPQFRSEDYSKFNERASKRLLNNVKSLGLDVKERCECRCDIMPLENSVEINVFNSMYAPVPEETLKANVAFLQDFVTLNQMLQTSIPGKFDIDDISFYDHLDTQVGREVALVDLQKGSVRTSVRGEPGKTYDTIDEYLEHLSGPRYVTVDMASVIANMPDTRGINKKVLNSLLAGYGEGMARVYP